MLGTEIQHFLGFGNAADKRAGKAFTTEQQREGRNLERGFRCTDQSNVTVTAKHVDVGVDVVIGGDGVEDEIERPCVSPHLFGIGGNNYLVGTQTDCIFFLIWGGCKDHYVCAEGTGKLDPHVPEAAETDNTHFFARKIAPATNAGVDRLDDGS